MVTEYGPVDLPNGRWFRAADAEGRGVPVFRVDSSGRIVLNSTILNRYIVNVDKDAQAAVIFASDVISGLIRQTSSTGASSLTFDTQATFTSQMVARGARVGDTWIFYVYNDGNQTVTLTGVTGITVPNTANTIAAGEAATVLLRYLTATTWEAIIVGNSG